MTVMDSSRCPSRNALCDQSVSPFSMEAFSYELIEGFSFGAGTRNCSRGDCGVNTTALWPDDGSECGMPSRSPSECFELDDAGSPPNKADWTHARRPALFGWGSRKCLAICEEADLAHSLESWCGSDDATDLAPAISSVFSPQVRGVTNF